MRKLVIFLNIVIIGATVLFFTPKTAYGASVNYSETTNTFATESELTDTATEKLENTKTLADINQQLQKINQAIQDNQQFIQKTENDINIAHSDIQKLELGMTVLEEKIKKRGELLKDRARSYQETGGNLSYLDLILGAASFNEFIDRAGTVARIVQADRDLYEEQSAEKEDYEFKHKALENRLEKLKGLKTEYEGMQSLSIEQRKQYENLKEHVEATQHAQIYVTNQAASQDLPIGLNQGWVTTVLTISQKYIGHSVYVFGGGRTTSDIQNGRFDCSGFVHWALSQAGINVGTSTDSIKTAGRQVSANSLQPGDLVFFDTYKQDGHVGIYIGNGQFIGSQCTTGVAIADMTTGYWQEKFHGRVIRV
jgi:peptidoglycan hydrolase CwlO-like protein